jgi:predicted dehydrogenase
MSKQESSSPEFSRRTFFKTTGHLAAASALVGIAGCKTSVETPNARAEAPRVAPEVPNVHPANNDTLKLALIGCGSRGTGAASQALHSAGPVKLVAMGDVSQDKLDGSYNTLKSSLSDRVEVAEENKFVGFDAYQRAIAMADVVILTTPPGFRPSHFEEAVRQGKHIFMEKPVAVDAPGIRRVLAAAEEAKKKNLKVGVGFQRHHQTSYLETMQRLRDGAIGDIVAMRCYWDTPTVAVRTRKVLEDKLGRPATEMEYQVYNWYYFVWTCGDHIVEQHVHNLDVINWVKQAHPVKAWGMGGRERRKGIDNGQIFDHHYVEFEYPDGTRLSSQCRHMDGCWENVSEHVRGTKGKCDVGGVIEGENPWRFPNGSGNDAYQQEHNDLFAAIRNDTPYNETALYGAFSTMTAIMGRMATYSGVEVNWDEAINSQIDTFPKALGWDAEPPVRPDASGHYPVAIPGVTKAV